MIRDYNIGWLEKRIYIPWSSMTGVAQIVAAGTNFRSQQSATSLTAAVASSLVEKLGIGAQNDGASHQMMVPYDLDINKRVRWRVFYTQTSTSGTVTWKILYGLQTATQNGTAGATVIAAPATALDTAIPAASGTTVSSDLRVTDFGVINRATIPDSTDFIIFAVTCTDASPVAGLGLLGVEMRYTMRKTEGPRRNLLGGRRLVTNRPLGVQLATGQEGL